MRVRLGRGLVYQFRTAAGGRFALSLPLTNDRRGLWWDQAKFKVVGDGEPVRPYLARFAAERRDPESSIERDILRHTIVMDFLKGGVMHRTSAASDDLRPLMELLSTLSLGSIEPPKRWTDSEDPFVVAARTFIDLLVRGDLLPLLDPLPSAVVTDRGGEWLHVLSATINGDIAGLQRLAAMDPLPGKGTPLASFCGNVFKHTGFIESALRLLEQGHQPTPSRRCERCIELAQLLLQLGDATRAHVFLREATLNAGNDPEQLLRAVRELMRVEAIDDAYHVLSQAAPHMDRAPEVLFCLAELQHVAGHVDKARTTLDRIGHIAPGRHDVARERAALAMTEERFEDARTMLQQVLVQHPRDWVASTWLTEAHLRLGDIEAAEQALKDARSVHDSPIHTLLQGAMLSLVELRRHDEFKELLADWDEPWSIEDAAQSPGPHPARDYVLSILPSFRGSRGENLTRVSPLADGPTGVRPVATSKRDSRSESRQASAEAVKSIVLRPPEAVFEAFEQIIAQYPDSPHPWCYRGEVRLWLGDFDGAMADFDAAMLRDKARWAFIGRAAIHLMAGRREEGLAQIDACQKSFDAVPSATTHIYLGEADRKEGKLDSALTELRESVRVKPGRISGWINLALTHHALGQPESATEISARVCRVAPRLVRDAAAAAGFELPPATTAWIPSTEQLAPVLERSLEMMRGNRSSHTVTYFDRDGVFRQARDAESWVGQLAGLRLPVWEEARRRALHGTLL
ncbi:MAG: tetratricopeptide repeat protein [Myxococcota bacterium]